MRHIFIILILASVFNTAFGSFRAPREPRRQPSNYTFSAPSMPSIPPVITPPSFSISPPPPPFRIPAPRTAPSFILPPSTQIAVEQAITSFSTGQQIQTLTPVQLHVAQSISSLQPRPPFRAPQPAFNPELNILGDPSDTLTTLNAVKWSLAEGIVICTLNPRTRGGQEELKRCIAHNTELHLPLLADIQKRIGVTIPPALSHLNKDTLPQYESYAKVRDASHAEWREIWGSTSVIHPPQRAFSKEEFDIIRKNKKEWDIYRGLLPEYASSQEQAASNKEYRQIWANTLALVGPPPQRVLTKEELDSMRKLKEQYDTLIKKQQSEDIELYERAQKLRILTIIEGGPR